MTDFKRVYDELVRNKENHDNGYFNCIPFNDMPRTEKFLPGVEQDTYYILTASSGVGKSKLARNLFIHNPFQYVLDNPQYDIKLDIFYFSLEESRKKVILSEIAKYMYKKHGKVLDIKKLQSRGRYNTIDRATLVQIREAEAYVNRFLETVRVIDNVRRPSEIFEYMKKFAIEVGSYYDCYNRRFTEAENKEVLLGGKSCGKISYYKKNHPKHYVIVLTDHISLLDNEMGADGKMMTQWQTMSKFSNQHCISMRDKYGFIPVNVQQQASAKEQVEYNYQGKTIQEKLEPSLEGLGDNKTTQRDANVILGLFAPARYNIEEHGGYDILHLKDNYRSMKILKDRDGSSNGIIPLFFNGAADIFKELPNPQDQAGMHSVYQEISRIREAN